MTVPRWTLYYTAQLIITTPANVPSSTTRLDIPQGEPRHFSKEVQFFDRWPRYKQGAEFYRKRFEHCERGQLKLDATPNYLVFPERVRPVYEAAGGGQANLLRMILILRDPVARELSLYNHKAALARERKADQVQFWSDVVKDDGTVNGTIIEFSEFAEATTFSRINQRTGLCFKWSQHRMQGCYGLYAHHLKNWMFEFQPNQILVLSYDELISNKKTLMGRVRSFLRLDPTVNGTEDIPLSNQRKGEHKVSIMPCSVQARLYSLFNQSNEQLVKILRKKNEPSMEQRPFPRFTMGNCTIEN